MAPINTCTTLLVAKKTTVETIVGPNPVPSGGRVRVLRFGASAIGKGGQKAASIQLWWGASLLREFGLNESAFESEVDRIVASTGIEKLRIVMNNDDSTDSKQIIAWLDGYVL